MPELNSSFDRSKLDGTWVLAPTEDGEAAAEQPARSPQQRPLFSLVSVNPKTAQSAEVPWSRLLALGMASPDVDPAVLTVGRHKDCDVQLEDPRASLRHFEIVARRRQDPTCGEQCGRESSKASVSPGAAAYECILNDLSSNGTAINGKFVGKGNSGQLRSGDEISVLQENRVGREQVISFLFRNTAEILAAPTPTRAISQEPPKENTPQKDQEVSGHVEDQDAAFDLDELVNCPVCMQTVHRCVALMPCFHNFCSACYSDWMGRQKDDCPVCRRPVSAVARNHPMDAVIEAFLDANPRRRRSEEELRAMDARDSLRSLKAGGKIVRDTCSVGTSTASTTAEEGTGVGLQRTETEAIESQPPPTSRVGSQACVVQ